MSFNIPTLGDDGRLQNPQVLSQIRQIVQSEAKGRGSAGGGASVISGTGRPDIPDTTGGAITLAQRDRYGAPMPVDVNPGDFYYSEDACDGAILWVYQVDSWYGDTGHDDTGWHERPKWRVVVGDQNIRIYEQADETEEGSGEPEQPSASLYPYLTVSPDIYSLSIEIYGTKSEIFSHGSQRLLYLDDSEIWWRGFPEISGVLVARNRSIDDCPLYLIPVLLDRQELVVDFTSLAGVEDSDDEVWDIIGNLTWPNGGEWPYELYRHLHYYPEEEEGDE